MVGRSNVGKSSLINALVKQKIARTSAAPGKTRLANYYLIESPIPHHKSLYLVDLARLWLRARRSRIGRGVRAAHAGVLRSVDARAAPHGGRPAARRFAASRSAAGRAGYDWLLAAQAPIAIVATKIDKLNRSEQASTHADAKETITTPLFCLSRRSRATGLDEIWKLIRLWAAEVQFQI